MRTLPATQRLLPAGIAALAAACGEAPPTIDAEIVISSVDTLVPAEAELFERPSEATLGRDGLLFITDAGASRIFVFDTTGQMVREIGRAGAGPEEFQGPRSLTPIGDTLLIVDGFNARLQRVTSAGVFLGTSLLPHVALGGAVSLASGPTGGAHMLVSTRGRDNSLAMLLDEAGAEVRRLGLPPAALPEMIDFVEVKREIGEGRVPAMFRALAVPVLAPDLSAWLVLVAEGEVWRYSATGDLLWTARFEGPEFERIKARFFELNRADPNPSRFFPLNYVAAARQQDQNLWLLLRMPEDEGAHLVILSPDGSILARIQVPAATGVRAFDVDAESRTLYLMAYYDGALLRARLPGDLEY
ncbi:MAG: 6-bladed beta-propeller [Gemmatimonadales bacterium]|nr:6-bladed beta-propeller [Gemmatimonadales bacterium]